MAKKKGVASSDSYLSRAASADANMSAATKKGRARSFASGVAEITGIRVGRKGIKNIDPISAGLTAMSVVPGLGEAALGAKVARGAAAMGKVEKALAVAGRAGKELSAARKVAAGVNKAAKVAAKGQKFGTDTERMWKAANSAVKMGPAGKPLEAGFAARAAAKQAGRSAGKRVYQTVRTGSAETYSKLGATFKEGRTVRKMDISKLVESGKSYRATSRVTHPEMNSGAFKGRTFSEGMVAQGKKIGGNITDLKATIRGTGNMSPVRRGLERVSGAAKSAKNLAANAGGEGVVKSAKKIVSVKKTAARARKSGSRPVELDRLIGELFK